MRCRHLATHRDKTRRRRAGPGINPFHLSYHFTRSRQKCLAQCEAKVTRVCSAISDIASCSLCIPCLSFAVRTKCDNLRSRLRYCFPAAKVRPSCACVDNTTTRTYIAAGCDVKSYCVTRVLALITGRLCVSFLRQCHETSKLVVNAVHLGQWQFRPSSAYCQLESSCDWLCCRSEVRT